MRTHTGANPKTDLTENREQNREYGPAAGTGLALLGLTKHYKGFSLQDVDLEIPNGSILGLIGENGAGKSTMIKAILGLIRADAGTVYLFGRAGGEYSDSIREDIGVVMGELNLPATFNGREIGRMMAGLYRNWNGVQYDEFLDRFNIDRKKKLKEYSRGMKMKAAIAIALSHGARLLVLDEPTNGLDPIVREEVLDLLREFVIDEDHSVLISSHIISDLEKIADYVAFLHQGRLLLCDEKDRMREEYRLLKGDREALRRCLESGREGGGVELFGIRENSYGASALVKLHGARPEREGLLVEPAPLEDIMLYLVKGTMGENGGM